MNQHVIRPDRFTRNVLRRVAEGALAKDAAKMEGIEIELHKIKKFCEAKVAGKRILIARTLQLFLEFLNRAVHITVSTPVLLIHKSLIRIRNIEFDIQPTGGYVITLHYGDPSTKIITKQDDVMIYPFRPCRSKLVIWCVNIIGSQGGSIHLKDGTSIVLKTMTS